MLYLMKGVNNCIDATSLPPHKVRRRDVAGKQMWYSMNGLNNCYRRNVLAIAQNLAKRRCWEEADRGAMVGGGSDLF